ncbi:MAG: methyl-accepting chemotaxis protein [Candidatus Hodarchaeales archaeon]
MKNNKKRVDRMDISFLKLEKIAYKLALLALVVSLGPLAVVTFLNTNNLQNQMYTTSKHEMTDRAVALTHIANEMLSDPVAQVESLAHNPAVHGIAINASLQTMETLWDSYEGANFDNDQNMKGNKSAVAWDPENDIDPEFSEFLDHFADEHGFIEIFFTDARGYTFACNKEVPGDFLQLDEGWWTDARTSSEGLFVEFGYDDSTESFLMEVIMELNLHDGTFVGMVKAGYNVKEVNSYLVEVIECEAEFDESEADLTDSFVFMVDSSGKIFTHVDTSLTGSEFSEIASPTNSLNERIYTNLSSGLLVTGFSKLNIEGTVYFAGYMKLEDWDISLFAVSNAQIVDQTIATSVFGTLAIAGGIALVCVVASLFLATTFAKPINNMAQVTEKAATGDLTGNDEDIDTNRKDEIGVLGRTFRTMLGNLRNFITSSQDSAEQLASSAEELASTSEEVNALSEEIAATIQQISRGASSQSELSTKAIDEIQKMSDVVDQSLKDIEGTLQVIEDIAGQTNILALNAAIEAARAGEYGRGFAVVADNVRRLAEETKTNSSDISKVTTEIVTNIGSSVYNLQETLQSFAAQSEEFSASSEEVAAATEEQTAAMNQMTSAAQDLTRLGEEMSQLIAQYRTKEEK